VNRFQKKSRFGRGDRGAAFLEFAIIVPILLTLVMGIVEFGRAYNVVISLQGAAREGARVLALGNLNPDLPAVDAAVRSSPVTASAIVTKTACTNLGGRARVVASQNFQIGIPFIPAITVNLKGDASMRCGL
jgi:Flp pilus assembly protein TadG